MRIFIILFFLIVTVYIYMELNKFNFTNSNGLVFIFLK
jgi:cbb3-type cytochrome oxidase subunit 3